MGLKPASNGGTDKRRRVVVALAQLVGFSILDGDLALEQGPAIDVE